MPEAELGLAKALALSEPERTRQSLDAVLAANPNYPEARIFLANQLIDSEEYDKAEAEIAKAQQINRSRPKRSACWPQSATCAAIRTSSTSTCRRCCRPTRLQRPLLHAGRQLRFGPTVQGSRRLRA
jgi:tetratricopeptide (TPR) repeat protein